jgi:hypothetical protein
MQLRHGLYLILLLSAGCHENYSEKVSDALQSPKCVEHIVFEEYKPPEYVERPDANTPKLPERAEPVADTENKSLECVKCVGAGVEIIALTEQSAKEMDLIQHYRTDPGFTKYCVLFHDIPDSPPYAFQQKRLAQPQPDRYYLCPGPSSENILECKNHNMATGIVVSARGYLPGEKTTIRLSGKGAYREAVFCPRPLLMKKISGELLAQGTLLCTKLGHTLYELDICGIGKQEKYTLVSYSGEEILSHNLQGPISCGLSPEVIGLLKGIAKIELRLEDGASYSMELPWGHELVDYKLGNK